MPKAPFIAPYPGIQRLVDIDRSRVPMSAVLAGIDAIFFETATRTFKDDAEQSTFHHQWLGQYLECDAQNVWVALDAHDRVVGYLVGCWDDPGNTPRFAALDYVRTFAAISARFPAHLHINLTAAARNGGLGARLVDAFCGRAAAAGIAGVHVITSAAARNVSFYTRLGFHERARTDWNGKAVVFLGHSLAR